MRTLKSCITVRFSHTPFNHPPPFTATPLEEALSRGGWLHTPRGELVVTLDGEPRVDVGRYMTQKMQNMTTRREVALLKILFSFRRYLCAVVLFAVIKLLAAPAGNWARVNSVALRTDTKHYVQKSADNLSSLDLGPKTAFWLTGQIWSSDFHVSPVEDIKALFRSWKETENITFIDQSLSGACASVNTCADALQVLNVQNGIELSECPNALKRLFWKTYSVDNPDLFRNVKAFLFTYSTGLSEMFASFGKPMIIIAAVRYEVGRVSKSRWLALNQFLISIAADKRNTIAANNLYDLEYLRHFTGLSDIKLLPNTCDYVQVTYNRTRPSVLVGPSRFSAAGLELVYGTSGMLRTLSEKRDTYPGLNITPIREIYPTFQYEDLAAHPAVVVIPYAPSVMSVFEYYRMGLPIFAPSLDLLTEWQTSHLLLDEASWACCIKCGSDCRGPSLIEAHINSPHLGTDPNNLTDKHSMRHWLQFSDFYNWPGVQYFEDWDDLFRKLSQVDLDRIHVEMTSFSVKQDATRKKAWLEVLHRAFQGPRVATDVSDTWEQASLKFYPNLDAKLLEQDC